MPLQYDSTGVGKLLYTTGSLMDPCCCGDVIGCWECDPPLVTGDYTVTVAGFERPGWTPPCHYNDGAYLVTGGPDVDLHLCQWIFFDTYPDWWDYYIYLTWDSEEAPGQWSVQFTMTNGTNAVFDGGTNPCQPLGAYTFSHQWGTYLCKFEEGTCVVS